MKPQLSWQWRALTDFDGNCWILYQKQKHNKISWHTCSDAYFHSSKACFTCTACEGSHKTPSSSRKKVRPARMKYHQVSKEPPKIQVASQSWWGESSAIFSTKDYSQPPRFHCNSTVRMFWSLTHKIAPSTKPIHLGNNNSKNKDGNVKNDTQNFGTCWVHPLSYVKCNLNRGMGKARKQHDMPLGRDSLFAVS